MSHNASRTSRALTMSILLTTFLTAGVACNNKGNADNNEESSQLKEETAAAEEGNKEDEKTGVPVEVAEVSLGSISSYILLSSTIETESGVDIYPQTSGLVDELLVEEGDLVKRGSLLARLDDEEYSLDEAKSEVAFHKLENDFKRVEEMYEGDLISVEEHENARYELKQAELEWDKSKLLLRYTRIEAPISGVVSERLISEGDRINTSTRIFSIVNLDSLIAIVHVPEKEIYRINLRQRVTIGSDFIEGEEIEGWVKRISPVVDPNSGTFKVTVGIEAGGARLRPGMFVHVHIITGTHDDTMLVPRDAIVYDGGREYIFIAGEESTAARVELDKGFANNQVVEVLSGIDHDDHVIVVGQSGIKDGAKIRIVDDQNARDGEETG